MPFSAVEIGDLPPNRVGHGIARPHGQTGERRADPPRRRGRVVEPALAPDATA